MTCEMSQCGLATIQKLSQGRLLLGVGVGWMDPEFRALGVSRSQRGRLTDEGLAFIHQCFAADEVEADGQRFLFLPRPERPPIFIGGSAAHALERAVAHGDGWLPMGGNSDKLRDPIKQLNDLAAKADKPAPEVKLMTALPLQESDRAIQMVGELSEVGGTSLIQGLRYSELSEFEEKSCGTEMTAEHLPEHERDPEWNHQSEQEGDRERSALHGERSGQQWIRRIESEYPPRPGKPEQRTTDFDGIAQ